MNKPLVIAHRGASGYLKDNTMDAFRLAVKMGADFIELDVHFTKDGELIVYHPFYVKGKRIKELTLNEIKRIDNDIPTLKEVLNEINIGINIEIKGGERFYPGIVDTLLSLLKDYPIQRSIVSSFDMETLKIINKKREDLSIEGLCFSPFKKEFPAFISGINPYFIFVNSFFVKKIHSKGFKIKPYTVNNKIIMRKFVKIGVDGIFTDFPDVLKGVIEHEKP